MNVIIPMTGYGSRFAAAGYKDLKPFIRIMDKPIIEWIVKRMYPAEVQFIFVCRGGHLKENPSMWERLLELAPEAIIVGIEKWVKKGPVYDVLRAYKMLCAENRINTEDGCIINYCDFYMHWDYASFAEEAKKRDCDGAIPCYTGFHPHLLPEKNYYASCLTDEEDNLIEIREKYSFEKDKTKAKHSPGVYYFRNGDVMEKYCQILTEHEECAINGEFYASLPYNFMARDGLRVWIPVNVKYFCQWGTPEDVKEFVYWTDMIRRTPEGFRQTDTDLVQDNEEADKNTDSGRIQISETGVWQYFKEFLEAEDAAYKAILLTE